MTEPFSVPFDAVATRAYEWIARRSSGRHGYWEINLSELAYAVGLGPMGLGPVDGDGDGLKTVSFLYAVLLWLQFRDLIRIRIPEMTGRELATVCECPAAASCRVFLRKKLGTGLGILRKVRR